MGTETYPKTMHKIGEQKTTKFAPGPAASEYNQRGSDTSYPAGGSSAPKSGSDYRPDSSASFLKISGGGLVSATYPKSVHGQFPTEKAGYKTLKGPMSDKPKGM